ncbi:hypothetical protein HYU50_03665 [Candidatus Woesearchaeota archaeon]|nr:hypothetical protein [Candidatus Woesearchaeota archaeon]
MADPEVDDIFKDFEYKVKGKKETKEAPKQPVRQFVDDEEEEKPKKQPVKYERLPPKRLPNYEKIAYIAIILVLVAYTAIDWMYYHNEDNNSENASKISVKVATNATEANKTAAAKNETVAIVNKSAEKEENETVKEEGKQLSGIVTLTIDKIYTSLSKSINDTGYIDKIDFTIDNGKDKALKPRVDVYAYDKEIEESWQTRSRGVYLGTAIEPGGMYAGSISLSPKTFKNLNINKNVRLNLNDTDTGFIAAVNEEVVIS